MIVFEKQLHWYFLSAWNEGIITIIVIKKHHLLLAVPHDCFHRLISNHLILHCSITSISLGRPLHRYYSLRSSHCVKSVQIQSFFWSIFSRIRTEYDAEYLTVFSPNAGKHGPEKTSYLDTCHAVSHQEMFFKISVLKNFRPSGY